MVIFEKGGRELLKVKKSDVVREKMAKLGVDFDFDDDHYQKTHKDIKELINHLLAKMESRLTLEFTTKELEYLVYYISGKATNDPTTSTLVEKILNEIQRRKRKT